MSANARLRWPERILMLTGVVCALVVLGLSAPVVIARFETPVVHADSDGVVIPASMLGSAYLGASGSFIAGEKLGTITVPAIRLTAPVIEGVADSDLRRGVGHVPGSAQGGGLGNMVLAAHRDTIFRSLRLIQKGMDIQVSGTQGTYHYQVDSLEVVTPDRLDVLQIAAEPEVTLITCYPFNFIGSAPLRFIVKAHLVSAVPDGPAS